MKTNILNLEKTCLFFMFIISVIILVLAMPNTAFSEENSSGDTTVENNVSGEPYDSEAVADGETNEENLGQEEGAAEPPEEEVLSEEVLPEDVLSEEALSEEALSEDALSEEALSEDALSEEALSENALSEDALSEDALSEDALSEDALSEDALSEDVLSEEALLEGDVLPNDVKTPKYDGVRYNAIYFGGLDINGSNWDYITVSVTNVKTGEVLEGYLEYYSNNALLGYLTSGSYTDIHNYYKIEAYVYMPNGELMVVYGSSTGTAGKGTGYFTISFKSEGNNTIITPDIVEITAPLVPLTSSNSVEKTGLKENPRTSDRQLIYPVIYLAASTMLIFTLIVCRRNINVLIRGLIKGFNESR